jgi:hypothetical protein
VSTDETQIYGQPIQDQIDRLRREQVAIRRDLDSIRSDASKERALFRNALEEVTDRLEALQAESQREYRTTAESLAVLRETTAETNVLLTKLLALEVDPGMAIK